MVNAISLDDARETEISGIEHELSMALKSSVVRDSLVKMGDGLRIADEDMFSFFTRRGVYLDVNKQTKQTALIHLDFRESASTYQNDHDEHVKDVPVVDVLTPRQAAEYLGSRGVSLRKLQAKLNKLYN